MPVNAPAWSVVSLFEISGMGVSPVVGPKGQNEA